MKFSFCFVFCNFKLGYISFETNGNVRRTYNRERLNILGVDIISLWACGHFFRSKLFFSARGRARFFVDLFHVSLTWLAFHDFRLVDFLLSRFKRPFSVLKYFEVYVNLVRVADATYLYRIKFSSFC